MTETKKEQPLLSAYLVVGEDTLKRQVVLKRLRERMEKMGDLSFNSDHFDGEVAVGADIVSACNTLPFASDVRLVEVTSADKLKKADSEPLVSYLAAPATSCVLALSCAKLAKNTRLYKAVAALGKTAIITCDPPKARDLPSQVRSMAVSHGIAITADAASKLVELVGEDTVHLDAELTKLATSHTGTQPVSTSEVEELVVRTAEVKSWVFVDAFGARQVSRCLQLYPRLEKTASPYSLMVKCTSRLRQIICARCMADRGNARAAASALKMQEWQAKRIISDARGFTSAELRQAIIAARDAEQAMKSGTDPEEAFLSWVTLVCSRKRG